MEKKVLHLPEMWNSEVYGFNHAIVVESRKMLYISGQNGMDKDGNIVGKDFESQCRKTFENLKIILHGAGADFRNIVKMTGYLTDLKGNLMAFGKISSEYFKGDLSTQTLVEVTSLALPDLNVEIDAIAVLE